MFQELKNVGYQLVRSVFGIDKNTSKTEAAAKSAALSAVGATSTLVVDVPLTNIKTAIITSDAKGAFDATSKILKAVPNGAERATIRTGMLNMYAGFTPEFFRQNWRQLFRGPCVAFMPGYFKKMLPEEYEKLSSFFAGFFTAIIDATASTPLEARRQFRNSQALATGEKVQFRWYMGYKETIYRQVPAWMIMFHSMEKIRILGYSVASENGKDIHYMYFVAMGGVFAATFLTPTHPIDMLKIHQQQAGESIYGINSKTSFFKGLEKIFFYGAKKNGAIGGVMELWRGCGVSIIQRWPAATTMLCINEFFNRERNNTTPIKPFSIALGDAQSFAQKIFSRMKNDQGRGG